MGSLNMELGGDPDSTIMKIQSGFGSLRVAQMLFLVLQSEEISPRMWHLNSDVSVERCDFVLSVWLVTS